MLSVKEIGYFGAVCHQFLMKRFSDARWNVFEDFKQVQLPLNITFDILYYASFDISSWLSSAGAAGRWTAAIQTGGHGTDREGYPSVWISAVEQRVLVYASAYTPAASYQVKTTDSTVTQLKPVQISYWSSFSKLLYAGERSCYVKLTRPVNVVGQCPQTRIPGPWLWECKVCLCFHVCVSLSPGWFILAALVDLLPRVQTWCLLLGQAQVGALNPMSSE